MGGVDHFDQFNSTCSVSRKSKKWWLRLFYFMIDAALVNSYILYRSVNHKNGDCIDSHKHFNLSVARYLLQTWHPSKGRIKPNYLKKNNKATGKDMGVLKDLRFVNVGSHLPAGIEKGYRRCRYCLPKQKKKELMSRVLNAVSLYVQYHVSNCFTRNKTSIFIILLVIFYLLLISCNRMMK